MNIYYVPSNIIQGREQKLVNKQAQMSNVRGDKHLREKKAEQECRDDTDAVFIQGGHNSLSDKDSLGHKLKQVRARDKSAWASDNPRQREDEGPRP